MAYLCSRRDHLAAVEHRIERIEEVFNACGVAQSVQQDHVEDRSQDDLADGFATLVVNENGESRYIGASVPASYFILRLSTPIHCLTGSASPFSLLSFRGVSWVSEKTSSSNLARVIAEQAKWDCTKYGWSDQVFSRRSISTARRFKLVCRFWAPKPSIVM